MSPSRCLVLLVLPVATAGCDGLLSPGGCSASREPGVVVEIRDKHTGAPLAGLARGVVREGTYVDSLQPGAFSEPVDRLGSMYSRQAAYERAGHYTVTVERTGYESWTASDILVRRNACHVQTRRLRAELVPVS